MGKGNGNNGDFARGFWAEGIPFIWASGMAAILLLGFIIGLVVLILSQGMPNFWASNIAKLTLADGGYLLGSIESDVADKDGRKLLVRIGNRDINGLDFKWVDAQKVQKTEYPADAVVLERDEYGPMTGFLASLTDGGNTVAASSPEFNAALDKAFAAERAKAAAVKKIRESLDRDKKAVTPLEVRIRKLQEGENALSPETALKTAALEKEKAALLEKLGPGIDARESELERLLAEEGAQLAVLLANGRTATLPLKKVLAFRRPNAMGVFEKTGLYLRNVADFITEWPRESNTEGGVYPALFGTVLMVFIMLLVSTPLGIMAAIYMNEYARPGLFLNTTRLAVNNLAGVPSIVFGMFGLGFFVYLVGGNIDRLFYADKLPEPTFGTGGILWASLTLALLTMPVVVVSTLEGLMSVPRSNRDGALALGSSKFQMIWNVALPNAMPGILTGVILAVSRAAGEVAPLMITGVVKLVSDLPVDAAWPFMHLDRKFMHLGFHIYDVGFQSPNVEAAKPMVYTTTVLLLLMVVALNLAAIILRNKLRRKYRGAAL